MKFSAAFAATLSLAVLVNAQYNSPSSSSSSASSSTPTASASNSSNISVQVSAGGELVYSPSNFTASNGTIVTFIFPQSDHSVTQSSFADPCTYLTASGGNPAGFDSGLQAGKQFSIKITNDQEPIWFFCKNSIHCGLGMVGSINAPSTGNTYATFLASAKAIGSSEPAVSDSGPVTGGVGAVASGTPSPIAATSSSSSAASKPSSSNSSSASHLVANSFFALLATAFGIILA